MLQSFGFRVQDYGLGRKLEGRVYRVDWTARVPVPSANSVGRAKVGPSYYRTQCGSLSVF